MTHLEWGLLMVAAALVLGGLLGGPAWYAAGHRHGREDRSYGDGPRHRKGDSAPGYLLELPELASDPTLGGKFHNIHGGPGEDCWCGYIGHDPPEQVGEYGPFPVSEEEYLLLTSPLLPGEFEAHACQAVAVANDSREANLSVTEEIAAMNAVMEQFMAGLIGSTDEQLKEITR